MDKLPGFYSESAVIVSTVYGVLAVRAAIGKKLGGHLSVVLGLDCERGTAEDSSSAVADGAKGAAGADPAWSCQPVNACGGAAVVVRPPTTARGDPG